MMADVGGIENVNGSDFGDTLVGDGRLNELYGLGASDTLSGGAGADKLFGGDNDDVLSGDEDDDTLDGGAGVDTAHQSRQAGNGIALVHRRAVGIGHRQGLTPFDFLNSLN